MYCTALRRETGSTTTGCIYRKKKEQDRLTLSLCRHQKKSPRVWQLCLAVVQIVLYVYIASVWVLALAGYTEEWVYYADIAALAVFLLTLIVKYTISLHFIYGMAPAERKIAKLSFVGPMLQWPLLLTVLALLVVHIVYLQPVQGQDTTVSYIDRNVRHLATSTAWRRGVFTFAVCIAFTHAIVASFTDIKKHIKSFVYTGIDPVRYLVADIQKATKTRHKQDGKSQKLKNVRSAPTRQSNALKSRTPETTASGSQNSSDVPPPPRTGPAVRYLKRSV